MQETKKLYDITPYDRTFTATILSAEQKNGGWEIVLDQTLFFPEEGGQSADTGQIMFRGGADTKDAVRPDAAAKAANDEASDAAAAAWEVTDVQIRDGVICHRIRRTEDETDLGDGRTEMSGACRKANEVLCAGMPVQGRIDWSHRFSNMQNHTGEHIISGLIHAKYGFDNVGFHLSRNVVTLDQSGYLTPEQVAEIEWEANRVVWANLPVTAVYLKPAEAAKKTYRSKIAIDGDVRLVTIGSTEAKQPPEGDTSEDASGKENVFGIVDVCACCAPHVARTGEIGLIKILRSEKYKGGTRLTILCGDRALEEVGRRQMQIGEISHLLRAKQDEAHDAVQHLYDENAAQKARLIRMQQEKIRSLAQQASRPENQDGNAGQIIRSRENVWVVTDDLDPLPHRNLVNMLMEHSGGYAGVFLEEETETAKGGKPRAYRYIIGSSTKDCREAADFLREQFGARGGGKPEMVQGSVTAERGRLLDELCRSL